MATELEIMGEILHLRDQLRSGRAQEIVSRAGLTNADVAKVIGVSASSVWRYFNAERRPRRAVAIRLAKLLASLEVVRSAS
ncbi:MAG TPA: helix-turn-helix transcriptional regulator [Coriobacteriia bacterium]|nr:helix-turn-helix transcriptional regulator [Coriobacteriia bacterium]